jgi:hypothetical protein
MEIQKSKLAQIKNTVTDMKIAFGFFISRHNTTKEKIREFGNK